MQAAPKRWDFSPIVVSAVLILATWLMIHHPSYEQLRDDPILTFKTNPTGDYFERFAVVTWFIGLGVFVVSVARKNWLGLVLLIVGFFAWILIFGPNFIRAGDLHDMSSAKDDQGNEYHLLMMHFLQGSRVIISKEVSQTVNETKYEILAEDSWEGDYLTVALPDGAPESPNLYLTAKGLLVGVPDTNRCFVAYDLNAQVQYTAGEYKNTQRIKKLSPSILLGQ